MAMQSLSEAEKMARVPGIVFATEAGGRRARIAGTGIDVYSVIKRFRDYGYDEIRLREWFDWLSERQMTAALTYWRLFPDEIDERIHRDDLLENEGDGILPPYHHVVG